jgi:hypothetical protein
MPAGTFHITGKGKTAVTAEHRTGARAVTAKANPGKRRIARLRPIALPVASVAALAVAALSIAAGASTALARPFSPWEQLGTSRTKAVAATAPGRSWTP